MNIESIIRAWKADEDTWEDSLIASPVGRELTEEEMLEVSGADCFITECTYTCNITCTYTIGGPPVCGVYSACTCSLSGATAI